MSKPLVFSLGVAAAVLLAFTSAPTVAPAPAPAAVFHCQVPCGIYGDAMRVEALKEDAATIAKAMAQLNTGDLNMNQTVRWVLTKDEHAQKIQDQVGDYWLAQRVKLPAEGADAAARQTYGAQLMNLHRVLVAAMKCKQTTDDAHVQALLKAAEAFNQQYFSAEDLKHLREHR